jgi:hypothetical protein
MHLVAPAFFGSTARAEDRGQQPAATVGLPPSRQQRKLRSRHRFQPPSAAAIAARPSRVMRSSPACHGRSKQFSIRLPSSCRPWCRFGNSGAAPHRERHGGEYRAKAGDKALEIVVIVGTDAVVQ